MNFLVKKGNGLAGEISIPGDKSISHRSIILASLAEGSSRIYDLLEGEDCLATIEVFKKMGVGISLKDGICLVDGKGIEGLKEPDQVLDFGNSGTSVRLCAGLLSAQRFSSVLIGDESLSTRPMQRIVDPLTSMGANISGIGSNRLLINGVKKLNQVSHSVVSDRIEAGSFAIASSITMGNVEINNINPKNLTEFTNVLKLTGSKVEIFENSMKVSCSQRPKTHNVETDPYPGFPTDLQAQYMALMAIANGKTLIRETIFENRFMHVPELMRMGAKIFVNQQEAEIHGVKKLKGAKVMASDLRASMCLILAALAASGTSEIDGLYHLDRGYENLEDKLTNLGAIIKRSN